MSQAVQLIFIVLAMAAAVYMLVVAGRVLVRRNIRCPEKGIDVDVEFRAETDDNWEVGRPLDVVRCDAFEDPTAVTCDKHCLKPQNG